MTRSGTPILQYIPRPGILDLSWGHPRPALLPVRQWQQATEEALDRYGWQALAYGHRSGPAPLLEWLGPHMGKIDGVSATPDQFFVTAGASHALTLAATVLTQPGHIMLVDVPTYHYALRIFRDQGLRLLSVPHDSAGLDVMALDALVRRLRSQGDRVHTLYLVATYCNPTGLSLPSPKRADLVRFARAADLTIIEDDSYRELGYEGEPPPSVWAADPGGPVIRIGSFSKTVSPGLRLGFIQAPARLLRRLERLSYVESGGGLNHTVALTMAVFAGSQAYRRHMESVRAAYRDQRDALVGALRDCLPHVQVPSPAGGWFVWLPLPDGKSAGSLLSAAEREGVSFVEGTSFHVDPGKGAGHIRLSFSLLPPERLGEAAERLARAISV